MAANSSNSQIVFYHTTQVGGSFSVAPVGYYAATSGSAIFTSIGDTRLETPGGPAGLVTVADLNATVFGLFTSRVQNRTVVEAVTSGNYGISWGQSFIASATVGSVNSPEVTVSPAGYLYATWAENGVGPWGIDSQEFAPSGQPLGNATELPGSATFANGGSEFPSVAVDGLQQALYTWTAVNASGNLQIEATGGFLNDVTATQYLWQTLNATEPEDFAHGLPPSKFHPYESSLASNLSAALVSERADSVCNAETTLVQEVYPYVTHDEVAPLQRASGACGTLHAVPSEVAYESGATTLNLTGAVEAQWALEALGFGVFASPDWSSLLPAGQTSASVPLSTPGVVSNGASWLRVTPLGINPKTVLLNASSMFTVYSSVAGRDLGPSATCGNLPLYHSWLNVSSVVSYATTAWISTQTKPSPYVTAYPIDSYYLTNLTPRSTGTWEFQTNGTYEEWSTLSGWCPRPGESGVLDRAWPISHTEVSIASGWPRWVTMAISGLYSTYFGYNPGDPWVNVSGVANGHETVQVNWTNSLEGNSTTALADLTQHDHIGASSTTLGFSLPESWGFTNVPTGHTLIAYENSTSYAGNTSNNWGYTDNTGQQTSNTAALTAAASCTLSTSPPPTSIHWWNSTYISNVTGTTAVLTWYASDLGNGWVHYIAANGSWETAGAEEYLNGTGTYYYQVTLHGLTPWDFYTAVVGVTALAPGSTCEELYGSATWTFQTLSKFSLTEHDLPYDSITQQGGGAVVDWSLPQAFAGPDYVSGELTYFAVGNATLVQIPLATLPTSSNCVGCYSVNLTGLTINHVYNVSVALNFTYHGAGINGTSYPFTFWYEKDSSGDGLTDWEKVRGWEVTTTGVTGAVSNQEVTAVPGLYATNGLVGDYVEKEYGLNPNTVDSAGSHMLDTWNLTFNLSQSGGQVPSGANFHYWYEASSYNPFSTSVYYSPGLKENGNPVDKKATDSNISAAAAYGITSGDGSPYAARILWSYSALQTFVDLPGVQNASWLRAIYGEWNGYSTLTVEGKLSWGANPLAASTPGDGIADGVRVNPLYDVGLEFRFVYANLSNEPGGTGYAVRMFDNYTNDSGRAIEVDNWSWQAIVDNGTNATVYDYNATLSVTQSQQNQTISLEVSEDLSGWPQPAYINGSGTEVNVTYDLVRGGSEVVNVAGTHSGGQSTLFGVFQEAPMGAKAPTWLWIPTDNSTVNGLPIGLQRYVGEQSFDLVVVNASKSITSDPLPQPWGGYNGTITLSSGMNDFLIPREQFLDSPFGQAIFLGRNTSFNSSQVLPLVNSSEQSKITGFHGANLMVDLGAYWQNRAIVSGPGNITNTTENGTPNGNSLEVHVMAAASATSDNTGGLPSNPNLYSTVGDPSALQSIVTLNITSTVTLDLLLAALIDNTTGGANAVNGTIQSVTYQIGFLGLNGAVVNAISNATDPSDGLWGPPTAVAPHRQPSGFLGEFWNAVTSFVTNPLGTVLSAIYTVWNAATAALTYLNHLAHEAAAIGAEVVARSAAAIVHVGQLIANALSQLLQFIIKEVTALLSAALGPIIAQFNSYASKLVSDLASIAGGNTSEAYLLKFWDDAGGPLFVALFAIAAVLGAAVTVVSVLSLGAGFLVGLLIGLVVTVAATIAAALTGGFFSALSSWSSAALFDLEGFFNSTSPPSGQSLGAVGALGSSAWQSHWDAYATVFGVVDDLVGLTLGPALLGAAVFATKGDFGPNDLTGRVVDMAAGVLAVGIDVAGLIDQSDNETSWALFLSIWGTLLGGGAFLMGQTLEKKDFTGPLKTLDEIATGLDVAGFGIGAATIIIDKVPMGGP